MSKNYPQARDWWPASGKRSRLGHIKNEAFRTVVVFQPEAGRRTASAADPGASCLDQGL